MCPAIARRPPAAPVRPAAEAAPLLAERTEFLIRHVGGVSELARTLGVAKSQPSRWRTGRERPSPAATQRLLGLDYVLASALQVWEEPVAEDWLRSANGHLAGARPLDVLEQRGPVEVIEALQAELSGAYV